MFGNGIGSRGFVSKLAAQTVTLLWYCCKPLCGKSAFLFDKCVPMQFAKAPRALPLKGTPPQHQSVLHSCSQLFDDPHPFQTTGHRAETFLAFFLAHNIPNAMREFF